MGGTYWYYYQLNDEIEFHNSAEPSTTSCPLLPGQLVNVLHVPFHLSHGRSRNDSTSSTSSELRTMNPEDKFLNPRPVPIPQPKLARLNTSPTLPSFPGSSDSSSPFSISPWSAKSLSSSRGASPSTNAMRMFRLPRKASTDAQSRSTSPPSKSTGLRAAFRQLKSVRSTSPEDESSRGRVGKPMLGVEITAPLHVARTASGRVSKPSSPASSNSSRDQSPMPMPERQTSPRSTTQLALRRGLDQPTDLQEGLAVSSFQAHRRQRSKSRDPSPLRNSLILSAAPSRSSNIDGVNQCHQPLETLKEAPSQQSTPTWPLTALKVGTEEKSELPTEKRLPTLPNSPSSAYPASAASDSPEKTLSRELQLKELQSHFSEMTLSTDSSLSLIEPDHSHFSKWTTTSADFSPSSDYNILNTSSTNNPSPMRLSSSPYEVPATPFAPESTFRREDTLDTFMSDAEMLPSTISCSTISSCDSKSPPSPAQHAHDLCVAYGEKAAVSKSHYGVAPYRLPGSSLPSELQKSNATLLPSNVEGPGLDSAHEPAKIRIRSTSINQTHNNAIIPHSDSMQQLMDELSYLGDMIRE